MKSKLMKLFLLVLVAMIAISACAPASPTPVMSDGGSAQEPAKTEPTKAPADGAEPAKEPAAATPQDYLSAAREETLILDNPYRLEGGDNWNPLVPGNAAGWGLTLVGADPLLLLSYGTGEIENWMAESVEANADSTEWTVKLRDGITWNDGTPFTPDDIVYTVQMQMDNEGIGNHFYYIEWIKTVEKVDDRTVKFTLNKPNVRFLLECYADHLCGLHNILPKHVWEKVEDPSTFKFFDLEAGLPLGTGPYILAKVTENETIWVRNDNWWAAKTGLKKLPEPKKVIFSYVGTEEVRTATAIDNGFDALQDMTLGAFEALVAQNTSWIPFQKELPFVWPDPCARSLSVNNLAEPWNDKEMRWVLNYVMDRQQIIDIAYEGTSIMGPYPWPLYPSMQRFTDLVPASTIEKFTKPNTDEAARILTDKGYTKNGDYWTKDGKQLGLEIQVWDAFSELERVADVYIEQLQRFGINAVKVKLNGGAWGDNFGFGQYQAQSGWQTCGSIMEPWSTLRNMSADSVPPIGERAEGRTNAYRYYNPEYTALVDEIGKLAWDDPKLLELTEQALAIYYEDLPVIPTAQSKKLVPFNTTYWTNWPTADNYYQRPVIWCPSFIGVITEITSTKK
jgi:peptide/nickel transport system substrate-binding protein